MCSQSFSPHESIISLNILALPDGPLYLVTAGPPRVLPARHLSTGGPQRAPGGPHGPGCAADGDVSSDVQTDGDGAESRDRSLQPAGLRWPGYLRQGEAQGHKNRGPLTGETHFKFK